MWRDRSISYAVHNANKRAIALDADTTEDVEFFWDLVGRSDIIFQQPDAPLIPVSPEEIAAAHPHLIVVALTDFGLTGPRRDWIGTDAVLGALIGVSVQSRLPGQEPLSPPNGIVTESAAVLTAWSALAAYYRRLGTGRGEFIDASTYEAAIQSVDPLFGIRGTASGGRPPWEEEYEQQDTRHLYPIFRCKDGYVRMCVLATRQWESLLSWMGSPPELADPELGSLVARQQARDLIDTVVGGFLRTRTATELETEAERFGVPLARVQTPAQVFDCEQFGTRRAFVRTPLDDNGQTIALANGFVEFDGERAGIRRRAPQHDEHRAEVLRELADIDKRPTDSQGGGPPGALPFAGLRVLDLGVIVVGAEIGRLFADLGAEVIKVENRNFPDGSRQVAPADTMTVSLAYGHRNKQSLGLNLRDPRGIELFEELVRGSDVVVSNFKPGTMAALGLDYERLRTLNPGIVVADSSAFGPTGPWSERMGYGPLVRAATGLTSLWRYPELEDGYADTSTIYPDNVSAIISAITVLAALIKRNGDGIGARVSVSQAETILAQLSSRFAFASISGDDCAYPSPDVHVLQCAGRDQWCVVELRDPRDSAKLAEVLGCRTTERAALVNTAINWFAHHPASEAMSTLQDAGVPCGVVQRPTDLMRDPQLLDRQFLRPVYQPHGPGVLPATGAPARFASLPQIDLLPAPLQGQDTRTICRDVLRLSEAQIDEAARAGVIQLCDSRSRTDESQDHE